LRAAEGQREERHEGGIERGGGAQHVLGGVEDQALPGKEILGVTEGDERVVDRPCAGQQPGEDGEGDEEQGEDQIASFEGRHVLIIVGRAPNVCPTFIF
jgi:hypothetical protein